MTALHTILFLFKHYISLTHCVLLDISSNKITVQFMYKLKYSNVTLMRPS